MSRHLHNSISILIRNKIFSGEYSENERIPSEPLLAKELGISRATLREALKQLESEGILLRKHGVGTFVKSVKPAFNLPMEIPRSITMMIEKLGMIPGTAMMKINNDTVYPDDMEKLNLIPGSKVYRIERIRTANGQPVAYTIDVVPAWAMKKYPERKGNDNFSLMEHLKYKCGIKIKESKSSIIPLQGIISVAEKLEIEDSSHMFFIESMDYQSDGTPVLFSREYFSPWIFRITLKRNNL